VKHDVNGAAVVAPAKKAPHIEVTQAISVGLAGQDCWTQRVRAQQFSSHIDAVAALQSHMQVLQAAVMPGPEKWLATHWALLTVPPVPEL
jgi:hypothetical protein